MTEQYPVSKKMYYNKTESLLKQSAHIGQHQFTSLWGTSGLEKLQKIKPKNTLIFVFSSILDPIEIQKWKKYAPLNDLLWIHTFHPFEINPTEDIMFLSKSLNTIAYQKHFEKTCQEIQHHCIQTQSSYLQIDTSKALEPKLNYFFKNRYTHGYSTRTRYTP